MYSGISHSNIARSAILIALAAILVLASQAQPLPKARQSSKKESTETVRDKSGTKKQQARTEDSAVPAVPDEQQAQSPPNQTAPGAKPQVDQTNRDIANFTLALAIVSALQFLALIFQAFVLKHHSTLIAQ